MTTIAASFSLKEIAADSMVSLESCSYQVTKLRRGSQSVFGAAGEWESCLKFLAALEAGNLADLETEISVLELRRDGLWVYEGSITPAKIKNDFYAIGTGANFAIAAMRLGRSPSEAVAIACEFDPQSGGPIDVLKLGRRNASTN